MTTIINTPKDESSGFGVLATVVLFIVLVTLFIIYGVPQLKTMDTPKQNNVEINVTTPKPNIPTPATEGGQ